MAKKRATRRKTASPKMTIADTSALQGDAANPRKISDKAAKGLSNSIDRFGDLSGIVFNQQTGELVAGHQRMQQIRQRWGDRPIRVVDEDKGIGIIEVDDSHYFAVRVVNWSVAKQRAANMAANNTKIAGEFTDDAAAYLLEIEADLNAEAPGLLDDVLLLDLLPSGLDDGESSGDSLVQESYQVLVHCVDETHQRAVYDQLQKEGLTCKVLTL